MVGGYAIPEVNRLMNAFMECATAVNPDVKFLVTFINSWYDPPKAKEAAFAMVDKGADILYAERFGVSDAAKERGILAIGNVIDTSADYPGTILSSALWNMQPTIDKVIEAVATDSFEPADYGQYSFMSYGGGSFVVDESLADAASVTSRDVSSSSLSISSLCTSISSFCMPQNCWSDATLASFSRNLVMISCSDSGLDGTKRTPTMRSSSRKSRSIPSSCERR